MTNHSTNMANFNTHVAVAFLGSGGVATAATSYQLINWTEIPWFVFLGTIGGLLPDIDSDNSKQVKVLFLLLAISSALTLLTEGRILQGVLPIASMDQLICQALSLELIRLLEQLSQYCLPFSLIIIALISFLVVRYALFNLFKSLTVHRGVFHSILAAVFFALLTTCISHHFIGQNRLTAWTSGAFIGIGFIIHLLLDELFSVDVANARIKKSFGTAFKLFAYRNLSSSALMLLCTLYLYSQTPSIQPFIQALRVKM